MKPTSRLFYCPLGDWVLEKPNVGETLDGAYKRLARLARSYRRWGRSFRVEKRADAVLWWRVEFGKNTKLALWYALPLDQSVRIKEGADKSDLAKAKATARHLKRKGEGAFTSFLEGTELMIRRTELPRGAGA